MRARPAILDRYILTQVLAAMGAVLAIVMSLMVLEHLPRMIEITRWSGHRGEVIGRTVLGLMPEYAGIGVMVGLFLGIGLTVRKLALRGELDVMAAFGVPARRWMRLPAGLAVLMALATLLNQGWLIPAGERQLKQVGQEVMLGKFGQRLPAQSFVDVGSGAVLHFTGYDETTGELLGLFVQTGGQVLSAARGRIWIGLDGGVELDLQDGQILFADGKRVLVFSSFHQQIGAVQSAPIAERTSAVLKQTDIADLWVGGSDAERAAVYGRSLIALLILTLPTLANVLGKPPRRSASAFGLLVGLVLLVAALKLVSPLTAGHVSNPEVAALAIAGLGTGVMFCLIMGEQTLGEGFIDRWARIALARMQSRISIVRDISGIAGRTVGGRS